MLHAAVARPTRIKALIGIATAADMPERRFSNYPREVSSLMLLGWFILAHGICKAFVDKVLV